MKEDFLRTTENVLKEGPPLEWYYGFGRKDAGITHIDYSDIFRQSFNGRLDRYFGQWSHIGVMPRVFGIPEGEEDQYEQLIMQLHVQDL